MAAGQPAPRGAVDARDRVAARALGGRAPAQMAVHGVFGEGRPALMPAGMRRCWQQPRTQGRALEEAVAGGAGQPVQTTRRGRRWRTSQGWCWVFGQKEMTRGRMNE